jgi:hypothetical protein
VVKETVLRTVGEIRVGSIPTPRKRVSRSSQTAHDGLVAQLVERGAYTFVYTYGTPKSRVQSPPGPLYQHGVTVSIQPFQG